MNEQEKKPKQMPSAFPLHGFDTGMTLRDYFANSASRVIPLMTKRGFSESNEEDYDNWAKKCYKRADALLKQREL